MSNGDRCGTWKCAFSWRSSCDGRSTGLPRIGLSPVISGSASREASCCATCTAISTLSGARFILFSKLYITCYIVAAVGRQYRSFLCFRNGLCPRGVPFPTVSSLPKEPYWRRQPVLLAICTPHRLTSYAVYQINGNMTYLFRLYLSPNSFRYLLSFFFAHISICPTAMISNSTTLRLRLVTSNIPIHATVSNI